MNKKITLFLVLALGFITISNAQHLKRRAYLGAAIKNINDSTAKSNQLKSTEGVIIQQLYEDGTAKKIGLQSGDILLLINGKKISKRSDFNQIISKISEDDIISFTFSRNKKEKTIKGKVIGYKPDKYEYADVIYDEIPFENGYLRNVIIKPKGIEKCPVLFFIQGYTCASIDNMGNDHPYEKLLMEVVKNGIAVFKVEKPGLGDCKGTAACEDIDFYTELNAFEKAYQHIPNYTFLDTNNIFIFGHSMGGVIAPIMHRTPEAKGISVYGTVTRSWFEYFVEMSRIQMTISGEDYKDNENMFATRLKFNYEYLINKKTPSELAKDSTLAELLKTEWEYQSPDKITGRNYKYWQQLQDVSMLKGWADYKGKVLSIWGECDFVAFSKMDHEWIADITNTYHPGNGKFISLPNSDHAFTFNNSMKEAAANWTNGSYRKTHFNDSISKTLIKWIKESVK